MLPWWWSRYRDHNTFPVTFIDFGMTDAMRSWCLERGEVIAVDSDSNYITSRSHIDVGLAKQWETFYGWKIWNARLIWFKKPFALLQSPYEKGIWIDVDCEVLGSVNPLFSQCDFLSQLALVREHSTDHLPRLDPNVRYNGGVVAFQHGTPIVEKWAEGALNLNHLFAGDDYLLSHLIHTFQINVVELSNVYNWRMANGLNLNAVILHWVGSGGKNYIREHGGLKPSLDVFYRSFFL